MTADDTRITSREALAARYGEPLERALMKELDHLSAQYRRFVEASPFVVIASSGPDGLDVSPRGDAPGFVNVRDSRTLLLPDRRGNNRIDTLRNLISDPRISLLFMIPGIGETLRVNGAAEILADPTLNDTFSVDGKPPRCVILVHVQRAYYQCQKAVRRARLWEPDHRPAPGVVPSAGDMLSAIEPSFDGIGYDRDYPDYMKRTLY